MVLNKNELAMLNKLMKRIQKDDIDFISAMLIAENTFSPTFVAYYGDNKSGKFFNLNIKVGQLSDPYDGGFDMILKYHESAIEKTFEEILNQFGDSIEVKNIVLKYIRENNLNKIII